MAVSAMEKNKPGKEDGEALKLCTFDWQVEGGGVVTQGKYDEKASQAEGLEMRRLWDGSVLGASVAVLGCTRGMVVGDEVREMTRIGLRVV